MTGRPARTATGDVTKLHELQARVTTRQVLERPVLWVLAVLGAASLAAGAVIVGFSLNASRKVVGLIRAALLITVTSPLAMLLATLAPAGPAPYLAAMVLVITVAVALMLARGKGGLLAMYGLTALAVAIDAVLDGRMCRFALPSSFQLSGLRYYGIGNEYSGILIPMAALTAVFLARGTAAKKWMSLAIGVAVVALFGIGAFGANYGATAAATVTFALVCWSLARGSFGLRHIIGASALALIVVVAFAHADWKIAGTAGSHAARATGHAEGYDIAYLSGLVLRKVRMNFALFGSGTAQKAFLTFVPFIFLWFYRLRKAVGAKLCSDKGAGYALRALGIGAAAAFLLNDSGVVFAGIMLSMVVIFLVYSLLERLHAKTGSA